MWRALAFGLGALALAGCSIAPAPRPASHPASPQAPRGRLAGPPASLGAAPADLIVAPGSPADPPRDPADAPPHDHPGQAPPGAP